MQHPKHLAFIHIFKCRFHHKILSIPPQIDQPNPKNSIIGSGSNRSNLIKRENSKTKLIIKFAKVKSGNKETEICDHEYLRANRHNLRRLRRKETASRASTSFILFRFFRFWVQQISKSTSLSFSFSSFSFFVRFYRDDQKNPTVYIP